MGVRLMGVSLMGVCLMGVCLIDAGMSPASRVGTTWGGAAAQEARTHLLCQALASGRDRSWTPSVGGRPCAEACAQQRGQGGCSMVGAHFVTAGAVV